MKQNNNNGLSIGIEAKSYTVLNLTITLTNDQQEQPSEMLQLNDITKRQIERQNSVRVANHEIYYKDFQILVDQFSANSQYIEISVDTNHIELQICV